MPKYLILKHYRGAPATVNDVSICLLYTSPSPRD